MIALIQDVFDCTTLTCFLLSAGVSIILFLMAFLETVPSCDGVRHLTTGTLEYPTYGFTLFTSLFQTGALSCYDVSVRHRKEL